MNTNTNLQNTNIRFDSDELSGKRVLVTGGTKGMGEAIVKRLRAEGAKVMTTARSMPQDLESPELFVQADISTPDGVEKVGNESLTASAALIFWLTMSAGLPHRTAA